MHSSLSMKSIKCKLLTTISDQSYGSWRTRLSQRAVVCASILKKFVCCCRNGTRCSFRRMSIDSITWMELRTFCKSSYRLSCANHMWNGCMPTFAISGEPRPVWQSLAAYIFQGGILSPVSLFTIVHYATCTSGVARHPDKLHLSPCRNFVRSLCCMQTW